MKRGLFLLLCANPAIAQDYALRDGDVVPDRATLSTTILDRDLEYYDGGISRYASDGTYAWTYAAENGGGIWEGDYVISPNATICVTFDTGIARCDMFVTAGDRLVLLTVDGQRYPVRDIR